MNVKEYKRLTTNELNVQEAVCAYIKVRYPGIMFTSNMMCLRMSPGVRQQAIKLNSNHTHTDLVLMEPRAAYHGAVIELKFSDDELYKKDGTLRENKALQEQNKHLEHCRVLGYYAEFGCDYNGTVKLIDQYLSYK